MLRTICAPLNVTGNPAGWVGRQSVAGVTADSGALFATFNAQIWTVGERFGLNPRGREVRVAARVRYQG